MRLVGCFVAFLLVFGCFGSRLYGFSRLVGGNTHQRNDLLSDLRRRMGMSAASCLYSDKSANQSTAET